MVNSTVETLSPTRVKLHITVTPDELKPSIAHAYEHIAEDVQHPRLPQGQGAGADHRPARRPRSPFSSTPSARVSTRSTATPSRPTSCAFSAARRPRSPSGRARRTSPATCRSRSRSTCAPSSTFPSSTGSTVTVDAVEVDEAAIDAELDRLRSRFGTLVTVDRPAATGDFVELDLVATIDDERDRPRRGRLLRGRLGRAARGHRRGHRLAHRR